MTMTTIPVRMVRARMMTSRMCVLGATDQPGSKLREVCDGGFQLAAFMRRSFGMDEMLA